MTKEECELKYATLSDQYREDVYKDCKPFSTASSCDTEILLTDS